MDEIAFTGGSRIGWVNASWPFAKLSCDGKCLTLSSLGKYEFTPEQVVSFDTYGSIPLLANGLRINHNRIDYPEKVVFWCMGSRTTVLDRIAKTGFVPYGQAVERPKGFALKWSVVVAFVLIWNALFLVDRGIGMPDNRMAPVGRMTLTVLALAFFFASAVKMSTRVQNVVLRPGHSVVEIQSLLTLIQLVGRND